MSPTQDESPIFFSWRIKDETSPWRKKKAWRTLTVFTRQAIETYGKIVKAAGIRAE